MKKRNEKTNSRLWMVLPAILAAIIWVAVPFYTFTSAGAMSGGASNNAVIALQTNLSGAAINGTTPFGKAEYKVFADNSRKFETDVYSVNLAAGTSLSVFVDNVNVRALSLDAVGSGQLELKTTIGQTVPTITSSSVVQVKNGAAIIVAGSFNTGTPTPSPTGTGTPTGSPTPTGTPQPENEIYAPLTGAPIGGITPSGLGEFEVNGNNRRELKVYVRFVAIPAGTQLSVTVGGTGIGNITLNSAGQGQIEIEDIYYGQTIPPVQTGTAVVVKNGATTILAGVFGSVSPTPTPTPSGSPTPSPTGSPSPTATPTPNLAKLFEAKLSGAQVVPAVTTTARGSAKILLNTAGTQIQVFANFFGLSGAQTTATINGTTLPGSNAPVIFDLGTVGGTSGFFPVRTFDVTAGQVQQLRSGLWYVTIGNAAHPAGEIRGQLKAEGHHGDFEGDGLADISVFRPSSGTWYSQNSSNNVVNIQNLGSANDEIVPGDYDGDGRIDAAVFRRTNGVWEIKNSSNEATSGFQWGLGTDSPVVGDYDGDGRSDIGVYRPSNGTWYIHLSSTGGLLASKWGIAEDKPISADFDGDGKTDLAVYRPSTGTWYVIRSSNGSFFGTRWGAGEDIPVVGDFDGDGKADLTVFRPSTGTWYILRSIDNGFRIVNFGTNGDIPTAADFDEDWKTDIAVFRPSTGTWFVINSGSDQVTIRQFGINGDKPAIISAR